MPKTQVRNRSFLKTILSNRKKYVAFIIINNSIFEPLLLKLPLYWKTSTKCLLKAIYIPYKIIDT